MSNPPARTNPPPRAISRGLRVRGWAFALALVVVFAAAGVAVAARTRKGARMLTAAAGRWREMHTPDGGRARIVTPEVQALVAAMRAAGITSYRFTTTLGGDITRGPFIIEDSWPIECRLEDENVAGFVEDFTKRPDCAVVAVAGKVALARCHL